MIYEDGEESSVLDRSTSLAVNPVAGKRYRELGEADDETGPETLIK